MESDKSSGKMSSNKMVVIFCVIVLIALLLFKVDYAFLDAEQFENVTIRVEGSNNGSLDVIIGDQTTRPLILYFSRLNGVSTLQNDALATWRDVNVTDVTNFNSGDYIVIQMNDSLDFDIGEQVGSAVGNTINIDTPLGFDWSAGNSIVSLDRDMVVDGSVNPVVFTIQGPNVANESFDITRLIFEITCVDPPEWSEFCDLPKLTNGLVLRKTDGVYWSIFNIKDNSELANLMYDLSFYDQTRPQGVNGVLGRLTFAGQNKIGVAIRLSKGERLDLIVQDDLTGLVSFRVIAEGHIVD